ncbi:MAG: hypothetical protein KAJ60_05410 [Desulfobulbaceae bacterium]|nr:hypothetical protein [Desulfobulbaceae bacterium]MCK5340490.1 hypothetical protein [Desulfobulbaceae bacterium]MCK5404127.1 hypothetical protein [Desulfobulbaceae bacterium]
MNLTSRPIDMSKVRTIVYHFPEGDSITIPIDGFEQFLDFSFGRICDTSDIDGSLHIYPEGTA